MKIYYTYAWLRKDKTPYYIGKGQGNRAYWRHKKAVQPPPKDRILILKKSLTEEEAFKHEKYMIALYGKKEQGGLLRNLTDGGEGTSGLKRGPRKDRKHLALTSPKRIPIVLHNVHTGKLQSWTSISKCAQDLGVSKSQVAKLRRSTLEGKRYERCRKRKYRIKNTWELHNESI